MRTESAMRLTLTPDVRGMVKSAHPYHSIVNVAIGDAPHHIQEGLRAYTEAGRKSFMRVRPDVQDLLIRESSLSAMGAIAADSQIVLQIGESKIGDTWL